MIFGGKDFGYGGLEMYSPYLRPEEICLTNEEIAKQIRLNGDKEWRSYQEFQKFLDRNVKSIDWKVIGWVSGKTTKKWFGWEKDEDLWVLVRGNSYWFIYSIGLI